MEAVARGRAICRGKDMAGAEKAGDPVDVRSLTLQSASTTFLPSRTKQYGISQQQLFYVAPHEVGVLLAVIVMPGRSFGFKRVDGFMADGGYIPGVLAGYRLLHFNIASGYRQ